MALDQRDGRRGIGALLRDLAEGSATLVRDEVRLAKIEIGDVVAGIGRGTMFVAVGAVLALVGGLSTVAGIVLLVGDQWLPADLYWVAALIILLITGGLAVGLAKRGLALVSPSRIAPNETVTTLKEDKEWLRQRLTSGATSS
jgi:drug/metabolite transporter (DMT)-like permease